MSVGEALSRDTKYDAIFAALAAPFAAHEVKTRTQAGRQMEYVTARTVENRLDEVIGAGFWQDEYQPGENSVICRLTIELPDGRRVTKADAGGYAGMPDSGDDDKSGFSDAIKRAAARFGIGRYLYRDGVPSYAREHFGEVDQPRPQTPPRPAPPSQSRPAPTDGGNGHQGERKQYGVPKTGRALFAFAKEMEQKHEVGVLKYITTWARLQEFPDRMVDFDADQVALAHAEIMRKLQSIGNPGQGDAYEEALAN